MPAQPPAEAPGFSDYLGIVRKRRRLLLGIGLPILAGGVLLALGLPDVYRASGLIEIESAENFRGRTEGGNLRSVVTRESDEPQYADQYVQSLSELVLADRSLRRLLQLHQLYPGQQADPARALQQLRGDIDIDIVTVPIIDPQSGREREVVAAFSVAYDNRDPERARQGAAWLVDAFIAENRRDRQGDAADAAKFFRAEAQRIRRRVADLEAQLAQFKARNAGQLPELNEMNLNVMDRTENELRGLDAQLQALRRERVFLEAQLQQAQAAAPETQSLRQLEEEYRRLSVRYDESHPDLVSMRRQMDALRAGGSSAGMSLRAQLQTQRSILSEARQRYSEDHPDIKRIQRNIQALQARIAAGDTADQSVAAESPMAVQLQTQLNATDTQLSALQTRKAQLQIKLGELERRMTAAPLVEREFQVVTRDLASARAKYEELLRRQMDAEVSEAAIASGTADRFRIKSAPGTPREPAKPPRLAIVIVAVVLGAMAGLTAVVMAQIFDQTVRGVRDVREIMEIIPLSAVPVIQRPRSARQRKARQPLQASRAAMLLVLLGVTAQFFC